MKTIILTLPLIFLSACSVMDVDYKIPTAHLLTPETQGKRWSVQTELKTGSTHKVSLVEAYDQIFTQAVYLDENKDIEPALGLGANGYLGLFERFDAILALQDDSSQKIGFKFQAFGDPEKALTKGFKLSVAAFYGGGSEKQKTELKGSKGNTKDSIEGTLDLSAHELHFIPGYRLSEQFLIYLDGFYQKYEVEAELISKNSGTKTLDHFSQNHGLNLGMKLSSKVKDTHPEKIYFGLQGGWAKTYTLGQTYEGKTAGVNFGLNWK